MKIERNLIRTDDVFAGNELISADQFFVFPENIFLDIILQFQCRNMVAFEFVNINIILKNNMKNDVLVIGILRMIVKNPVGRFYMKFDVSGENNVVDLNFCRQKIRTGIGIPFSEI
jgi:hypothetical protein